MEYRKEIEGFIDAHKDEMIEDICTLCRINSEKKPYVEGKPYGEGTFEALNAALTMAEGYGFSINNYDNTLANAVCYYFRQQGINYVYRCITRLDRDTSGVLLLAKHMYSASLMSDDIKNRRIKREYLAVVSGLLPPEGTIDAPIARAPDSTIMREVNEETGAPARTHFKLLYHENGYSLAALSLETGRTHQIRVHMKHIGHPLPGDFLYYPDMTIIGRQALHSHKLQFPHPISGDLMQFTSPLPDDMKKFFSEIVIH